jgi:endonuclease/exonuclease/phosphatase family metal-dependent hydrolase
MTDELATSRYPFTFLACTYNIWGAKRWDDRRAPLRRFLEVNRPDILCLQELTPGACELIGTTLPNMHCVEDPFPGWTEEGNIYWNTEIFDLLEYGAQDIGILEQYRRLFWVRLVTRSGTTVVVATAHFSWLWEAGASGEWITVRVAQAEAAVVALDEVVQPDEPVLFMGDFNGYLHPIDVLRASGFEDWFQALGRAPVITHPAVPTSESPTLLDWMMHRGPIRPTLTSVVDFYVDGVPPSDHKPILTMYTLG